MKIRSLFFSDVHLGSRHSKALELLEYLREIEEPPERIYIIGDFIDGWKLKSNWRWGDNCNLVIRKLLGFVKKGTRVYYAVGNHDEFLRRFLHSENERLDLGSIQLGNEFVHTTANGQKLLVVHGDKFDVSIKYARWLCFLGDWGYELLLRLNSFVNGIRWLFGYKKFWSLSKAIKHKVKQAVSYVGDFEKFLTKYCEDKKCDGVICGHIHTADIKEIDDVMYYNTGDWVESMTAIVEHEDGRLELIHKH